MTKSAFTTSPDLRVRVGFVHGNKPDNECECYTEAPVIYTICSENQHAILNVVSFTTKRVKLKLSVDVIVTGPHSPSL